MASPLSLIVTGANVAADIGAMGSTGTEVTKEAATMVLTNDNFATIVRAVKEGGAIYDNMVKFVRFQLSTNMGEIQTVLGASLRGWTTPFTAIQIVCLNIIRDGPPAMSLGVEPARDVFNSTDLTRRDRGLAALVASSVLWLDEGRKLGLRLLGRMREPAQRPAA